MINGGSAASTNIIGFANNTVHTDTLGAGMIITNVTFDAVPGGVVDPVAGGVLTIGVDGNGVGGSGLTLTSVQGNLGFTDLDVYGGTTGLSVTGDATLGVVLTVVPPGSGGWSEPKGERRGGDHQQRGDQPPARGAGEHVRGGQRRLANHRERHLQRSHRQHDRQERW